MSLSSGQKLILDRWRQSNVLVATFLSLEETVHMPHATVGGTLLQGVCGQDHRIQPVTSLRLLEGSAKSLK